MANEAIDPDGNVIRPGMTIVQRGEVFVVNQICGKRRNFMLVADRVQEDGRKCRLIVGRNRLRLVHVIGFQAPLITYP